MTLFKDRQDAGRKLAEELAQYENMENVIVLALPRGGVPVAYEVAKALQAELDVFLVRKLGVPGHAELAMGAIASGGIRVMNDDLVKNLNISEGKINRVVESEQKELERREQEYRGNREAMDIRNRVVILIDDGLATGASMHAAVKAVRSRQPEKVVVAVPTAPAETCQEFQGQADEVVCVSTPKPFSAIGAWYTNFPQMSDKAVQQILRQASREIKTASG